MNFVLSIAAGGALGAVSRYYFALGITRWLGDVFPYGTLGVNIIGGLGLGMLVEIMTLAWSPGHAVKAFLTVGLLGGFTTFSSFSMETVQLLQRGETVAAGGYVVASLILSVGAFFIGMMLIRQMLT